MGWDWLSLNSLTIRSPQSGANNELQIDNEIKTRYGDIHSVSLFGHPVVVLSSLAAVNDFRAASPENFSHRLTYIVEMFWSLLASLINVPENFSHRWTKIVIFLDKEVCIGWEVPYQY